MARYSRSASKEVKSALHRKKKGTLKSGKGGKGGTVKSRKQAIAIALSEARKKGKKVPKPKTAKKKVAKEGGEEEDSPRRRPRRRSPAADASVQPRNHFTQFDVSAQRNPQVRDMVGSASARTSRADSTLSSIRGVGRRRYPRWRLNYGRY